MTICEVTSHVFSSTNRLSDDEVILYSKQLHP
jgi:hypothetical protein